MDSTQTMVYNGLQTSVRRRFSNRYSWDVNYTLGKSDSTQGGEKLELRAGESYQMKIIRLVPEERKIGLSIRALKDAEYRADWEAYTESTGRPEVTLGDHFKHLK